VKIDPRFTKASGPEVYTGNELLVKGCLEVEGGVHLWTGYPGSPVSGFFDTAHALGELLQSRGIRAAMANNEALAAAMVNGSQMAPLRAISVQKSVGVHVAADALALGNLVGAHPEGGALIVLGDDPWSESTQVPADSRFIAKHLLMPVMEPSDMQELKDWVDLGFKLSREAEIYIGYLVSTNQADGGGTVSTRSNHYPEININRPFELDTAAIDLDRNVLLPPRTWWKEETIHLRYARLWKAARERGAQRIERPQSPPPAPIGFVTSGAAYCYLRHALALMGLDGVFPILKLGITYPVDPDLTIEFARGLDHLVVVEERRPFLEEQIAHILRRELQKAPRNPAAAVRLWGKQFPENLPGIPAVRGLNPSLIAERLGGLFLKWPVVSNRLASRQKRRIEGELEILREVESLDLRLPARTPTFCPGCPHRDSASVLMEIKRKFRDPAYMRRAHKSGPVDLVFHGDTGCYTMLMFEPTKDLMHNYSGMGLGGGTGAGIDPFIRNKQVVFMGDSTFFHSGMAAISNSLKNGQDITYIILDNKTTAMTGHQTTPGQPEGALGEPTFAQRIDAIVSGLTDKLRTGAVVARINPADADNYRRLLEKTILEDGVKIVIADKECGITYHRRRLRQEQQIRAEKGFLPEERHINIDPEVCEYCLECTKATGCPGLTVADTPYGRKIQIDRTWCVADGACVRFRVPIQADKPAVKACPSFEEVRIRRSKAPPSPLDSINLDSIPKPKRRRVKGLWHGYLAGVGGMGIGTAGAILVLAGHKEGYRVKFCDKKGLAIRNGGVYSMITYAAEEAPYTSNLIPYGKADLVLGVDILEAARALDPKGNLRVIHPRRTAAVLNTHKSPTILTLLGKDDFSPAELADLLRSHTRQDRFFAANLSAVAERFFGNIRSVNIMMLGVAFQLGELPLSLESLETAIRQAMGRAGEENIRAFRLGRLLVHDPAQVYQTGNLAPEPQDWRAIVEDKASLLRREGRRGGAWAEEYRRIVESLKEALPALPESLLSDAARRVYDLIRYDGPEYASVYAAWVRRIGQTDNPQSGWKATRAVIWNLHKTMCIKDEVYVAALLTSEEKYRRDRARYNVDPIRGDRIRYRHYNRPQFVLFGRPIAFDIATRDWMLRPMAKMRWLRRLLPQWHQEEKAFRDWYLDLLARTEPLLRQPAAYETAVRILETPASVTGYREIRYPKMEQAKAEAEALLRQAAATAPPHAIAV